MLHQTRLAVKTNSLSLYSSGKRSHAMQYWNHIVPDPSPHVYPAHRSFNSIPSSCLPFPFHFCAATVFPKGHPLVLLSAPVLLLICPGSPPNMTHHRPIAAKLPDMNDATR